MKWFRHESDASRDIKLIKVEEKFGLIGYAAYWKLTEYCCNLLRPRDTLTYEITLKHCQNILRMKSKQTQNIIETFSDLNLFQSTRTDNGYLIYFPRLALIRDEHTNKVSRNSGVGPDQELDVDIDVDKEKEKRKTVAKKPPPLHPLAVIWNDEFAPIAMRGRCTNISPSR